MWEIVGWLGSGIIVASMLQQRITRLRLVNLAGCLVSIAYATAITAWPLAGLNLVLAGIQVYHLRRLWRSRHDPGSYRAVVVAPSDGVVQHVLARHAAEIARYFPNFHGPQQAQLAFLVLADDVIAAVVLARQRGEVAELDLDYATPAYQDLSPGKFIFQQARFWRDAGISVVRTAPNGPDYYRRIGFTQVAGRFELTLRHDTGDLNTPRNEHFH